MDPPFGQIAGQSFSSWPILIYFHPSIPAEPNLATVPANAPTDGRQLATVSPLTRRLGKSLPANALGGERRGPTSANAGLRLAQPGAIKKRLPSTPDGRPVHAR